MLKRIHQHFFLIATVLFAVLGFIFLHRLTGDAPKVADIAGLFVCTTLFGFAAISGYMEDLERKLNKWLEAETGLKRVKIDTATGSLTAHIDTDTGLPIAPYPERNHRDDLNHSLISSLGICLSNRGMDAQGIGDFIRKTADAILGGVPAAKASCTCGPNQGCTNCPSAGAQADHRSEAEIVAKGLTAPRVTAAQINALMDTVTWRYEQPEGTTSTFAHAFLGRFYLATGHSACVSPENFNADLGMKYAREQAEGKARDKLWELEGWSLHKGI